MNNSDISIREMTKTDAADVAVLSGELDYPASSSDVERRWDLLNQSSHEKVLVAERALSFHPLIG